MTQCFVCMDPAISLIKVDFSHGIKTYIVCQKHKEDQTYKTMQKIAVLEVSAIEDPEKFQSEVTKFAQELIAS